MSKASPSATAAKPDKQKLIFIVDDHPVFREGMASLINRAPDLVVCGEAKDAHTAFTGIEKLKPDLALVDIGLPGKSGLELIHDLRALMPEMLILVISMFDEMLYAERVLRAGGRGYIMKQEGPEKIFEAIRHVLAGQVYLSGKMSSLILDTLTGRHKNGSPIGV